MGDWDDGAPAAAQESGTGGDAGGGGGGGVKKKASAKAKVKGGPGRPKRGEEAKVCFICPSRKAINSKLCKAHHRPMEAMKYQSQTAVPSQLEALNQMMQDRGKCKVAIEDFMKENPTSGGRKRLIDWTSFKRRHGVHIALTHREQESLMDIDDYWVQEGQPKGWQREASDHEFKRLSRTNESEGSGASMKVWIGGMAQRFRDKTTYIDVEQEDSSKVFKDPSAQEKEELRKVAIETQLDFTNKFFRGDLLAAPAPSSAAIAKGDEEGTADVVVAVFSKRRETNVSDEAPKQYGKWREELPKLRSSFATAHEKLSAILTETSDFKNPERPRVPVIPRDCAVPPHAGERVGGNERRGGQADRRKSSFVRG